MEKLNERHRLLLVFGIIVLVIGLLCIIYKQAIWDWVWHGYSQEYEIVDWIYPYQTYGMILALAGIVLTALSLLLPENK
jgi:drug/metabolite transporter (DMT)-like permease